MSKVIGLGGNNQPPQQPSLNINLKEHPNLECSNCSSIIFETKMIIKKISKIITGTSTDQLAPIQILRCCDCGEILKESLPDPNMLDNE